MHAHPPGPQPPRRPAPRTLPATRPGTRASAAAYRQTPVPRTQHPWHRTRYPQQLAPGAPRTAAARHRAPGTPASPRLGTVHPASPHPAPRTPHPAPRTPHPAPRTHIVRRHFGRDTPPKTLRF
ncbi:hypothetical protein GCM10028864_60730 [Microlunatus parietis]